MTQQERFESKFDRTEGCWEWKAGKFPNGYGQFKFNGYPKGAHVVSYMYYKGLPGHLHVRHKCNNKKCVNPDHLELGTPLENADDRAAIEPSYRKIDLEEARKLINLGRSQRYVASLFGASQGSLSRMLSRHKE